MFVFKKVNGSKLSTGSRNLHMRLLSFCIKDLDSGSFSVWTSIVKQSSNKLWLSISPQGAAGFTVNQKSLLIARFNGFDHTWA